MKASQFVHWYHHPEDIDPALLQDFEPETIQLAGQMIKEHGLEEAKAIAQQNVRTFKPYGATQQEWLRWQSILSWLQQCSED